MINTKRQQEYFMYQIGVNTISSPIIDSHPIIDYFKKLNKKIKISGHTTGDDICKQMHDFFCDEFLVDKVQVDVEDLDITYDEWVEEMDWINNKSNG